MNPFLSASVASLLLAGGFSPCARAADKVTYADHVLPVFKNACLNCHNPDKKKAGLDLSTYQGTLAGSDNGKVVESGNASGSLLVKCVRQTEDPKMPPKGDKLSDAEIALLEKWITGQLLETATGKAVVANNNVKLAVVSLSRPEGPPPMPVGDLPLDPLVRTKTPNALVALAASPWAPLVAVGGQKQVILYHSQTLQTLGILPFPEGFPAVLRFSRNGQLLLTGGGLGGKSGQVVLWKVNSGERAGQVGNEFDQVLGADISPDHAHVALGGPTKILKIYSTKDGKLEHSAKKHTDWITAVSFSPDGQFLASADRAGGIVLWEGATGKEYLTLPGHKLMVTALAFMPGVLASASEDGKITLWNVQEGKEIRSWTAHAGGVESVDFTPDGRLVSSGRDKLAKVWDQNGKVLLTSQEFGDIALRAVLAEDRLIAGDWTGQIRVCRFPGNQKIGELTSNPPAIAESLAIAEKRLVLAQAQLAALPPAPEHQLAPAPAPEVKPVPAEVPKLDTVNIAALETQRVAAQANVDAEKAQPTPDPTRLAMLRKKRDEIKAMLAEARSGQASVAAAPPVVLDPRLAAETEAAAATADLQHWQRAQAYMSLHRARQSVTELTAKLESLRATIAEASTPVETLKSDTAATEKASAAATAGAKEKEAALANGRRDLEVLTKTLADTEAGAREKTEARKNAASVLEQATAGVAAQKVGFEAKKKEVEALVAAAAKLPEGSPERGAADAKLAAPQTELAKVQAAYDGSEAALTAAKVQGEKTASEAAAAEAALVQARTLANSAELKMTDSTKALATAQKKATELSARLAELQQEAPAVLAEAQGTKDQAETELVATMREVEVAKAQAEKARQEYEARYPSATLPQPIASTQP